MRRSGRAFTKPDTFEKGFDATFGSSSWKICSTGISRARARSMSDCKRAMKGDLQVGGGLLEPRERLRAAGDGRGVGRGGALDVEVGVLRPVRVDHRGVLGVELVVLRTQLGELDPGGAAEGDAHGTAGGAELGALLLLPGGARVVGVAP